MVDVAFIGLGIMGRGMVHSLLRAGHAVRAWNRTPRLEAELAVEGMQSADSIAAAVAGAEAVMLCVTGPEAQREVIQGPGGLLQGVVGDVVVVDSTTTDPALAREVSEMFRLKGLFYVDCPVFGGRDEAWEGKLDVVAGGPREAVDRVRPLLEAIGKTIHYMGESGSGATMKLIGNCMVAAQTMALGEGIAMARRAGLDPAAVMGVYDVVDFNSALISAAGRSTFAGNFEPTFYLKHLLKDAKLIEKLACELAVTVPATATISQTLRAAVNAGLGESNFSALHEYLFRISALDGGSG